MRLVVKKDDNTVNEFQFSKGPINIGRYAGSQVFLSDRAVSRYHAVIFSTQDGQWMVEDLDSANKTYLNDQPIHKAHIKTGDHLRVNDFIIEINLEDDTIADQPINLEDTLTTATRVSPEDTHTPTLEPQIIVRRIDSDHAPDMRLPAQRAKDFIRATEAICKADGLDAVMYAVLKIAIQQFKASHAWCARRTQPQGPMICHAGRQADGSKIEIGELKLNDYINKAVEKCQFQLIPRLPAQFSEDKTHSAMISPIVGEGGCFGVLYIDNDMSHEHFTLSDLDYLIFLSIHTSVIVENF